MNNDTSSLETSFSERLQQQLGIGTVSFITVPESDERHLSLPADGVPLPSLAELGDFVGLTQLTEALPPEITTFAGLHLTRLELNPTAGQAIIEVKWTDGRFPIMPGVLELSQPGMLIILQGHPELEGGLVYLIGIASLGDADLAIAVSLPDLSIRAQLTAPCSLAPLLAYFDLDNTPFADLQIDILLLTANPQDQVVSISLGMGAVWEPGGIFSLDQVEILVTKFLNDKAASGQVTARGHLAGIDVALTGAYMGSGMGWQLTAEAAQLQPIPIGDLVQHLAQTLDSDPVDVPRAISSLMLENISFRYETQSHNLSFSGEVAFDVAANTHIDLIIEIALMRQPTGVTPTLVLESSLNFSGHKFQLDFAKQGDDQDSNALDVMVASFSIPTDFALADLVAHIAGEDVAALLPGLTIDLAQVAFAYVKQGSQTAMLFTVAVDADMTLAGLPLVGAALPSGIGADGVQVVYATAVITAPQADVVNSLLPANRQLPTPAPTTTAVATPSTAPPALSPGFSLAVHLHLPTGSMPILANSPQQTPQAAESAAATTPPPASDNVTWFDVQRSLGPITLKRVGARYADQRLWLLLNADLSLAAFTIGLQGLGIGFKVGQWGNIQPMLSGLSLGYEAGPLDISGTFAKSGDDYLGAATIKTGTYSLSAIGAYGESDGETTLFIYAMLTDPPIGGPSFFYVTGLSVGFGYNRAIRVPTVDEMTQFPLVSAMMPEAADAVTLTPNPVDPLQTLAQISAGGWIRKAPGQNWLAAGVRFTSFEMVQSFALATVKFGTRFEVAISGLSQLTIPAPDPASGEAAPDRIAYAEVAFSASFIPDEGVLRADGKLTPASYILVKEARPTGGFAFYLWQDGDFVISFGGYHPHFDQGHYPDVPRLGIDFYIGSSLHVTAKAYFALTPSAIMAGGYLDAVYDGGPLQAWFKAGADFLLMWKPFHYEVTIFVHIGASFTLDFAFFSVSVTVELGADLALWGPPLGGTASITYSIASFTIGFGADRLPAPPLIWSQFRDQFLPTGGAGNSDEPQRNGALLNARVSKGLVEDLSQKTGDVNPHSFSWAVYQDEVVIEVTTAVPATTVSLNSHTEKLPDGHYNGALHIGPMKDGGLNYSAPLEIRVEYVDIMTPDIPGELYTKVKAQIVLGTAPKALWSNYNPLDDVKPQVQAQPLSQAESRLLGTIASVQIQPVTTDPDETAPYHLKDLLFEEHDIERVAMFDGDNTFNQQTLTTSAPVTADIAHNDTHAAILRALHMSGIVDTAVIVDLTQLAKQPGSLITQPHKRTFRPEEAVR